MSTATVKVDFTAILLLNKHADPEPVHFKVGDALSLMQTWNHFYLVKDAEGHFYNVSKDKLDVE
jgi:hypothetical protein